MQCVILAWGLGTRIIERSGGLPKALIPVPGKPFLFYQLEWLARQNVRDVTGHCCFTTMAPASTAFDILQGLHCVPGGVVGLAVVPAPELQTAIVNEVL
jgi:hypothetical protein